jgi:nucleotide-binding universal stress UspA family protein
MPPPIAFPTIVGGASREMSISQTSLRSTMWERVLCAVDIGHASVHAAVEAARLMPATGQLSLCTVVTSEALETGTATEEARTRDAQHALERAQAKVQPYHDAELHLREGAPIGRLLEELRTEHATVLAVGRHGPSLGRERVLGRVAAAMLHEAPCSVLVASENPGDGEEVVVGFDGSGGARRALVAGRELCERLSLRLRVVVATGDVHPPGRGWLGGELEPGLPVTEDPRSAVEALTDASRSARLLILGSRHLPGVAGRSSVSERATLRAGCAVLVVR